MKQKNILILSTYPIKQPRHGGQKRVHAIYEAYCKAFANVKHSAVFYKGFYSDYAADDIALGPASDLPIMQSPLTSDIVSGEAIYKDPVVKKKISDMLLSFKPGIIHVEQPFLYIGLKPLLNELKLNPKLVFGSENIEAPMKRAILEGAGVAEPDIARAEALIADLEESFSRESDLVVACTTQHINVHARMGATNLVLASNGIAPSRTDQRSLNHWQSEFQKHEADKTALFVGSAHPPNWTGFLDTVGKGLGFLPINSKIVVAGSICDYFDREINSDGPSIEDATFWLRAISAGRLSEESLGALIQLSDVMLLPITEGGGSNLKTAEAILADKKVVATSHSLRSFEWFSDFPNIWIADSGPAFREAISEALTVEFKPRTAAQKEQAKQVEWSNCLAEMVKQVEKL